MHRKRKSIVRFKKIGNFVIEQTVIAMMQNLTRNILNNKLNKFRYNFTIECQFPIVQC